MQRLNRGFVRVDKMHSQIQKEVKNKLPRRESERRNHPLARHVDILSAIETRLSLLGMSYSKYMDSGLCCFIPGKVCAGVLYTCVITVYPSICNILIDHLFILCKETKEYSFFLQCNRICKKNCT